MNDDCEGNYVRLPFHELKYYIDNMQIKYFKNPHYNLKGKQLDEEAIDLIVINSPGHAGGRFKIHDTIATN